jgi:predicted Zn finger-like uncharacterized protein
VFTQCAKCETVFRLSAEALRAAGGQVRCGRCGEVFNALARLAEDASGFTQGESPLDLETRADAILHSTLPVEPVDTTHQHPRWQPDAPPGVEIAHLEIFDPPDEDSADTSLEFTLPPGDLDRIFVETRPNSLQQLVAGKSAAAAPTPSGTPTAVTPPAVTPSAVPSLPPATRTTSPPGTASRATTPPATASPSLTPAAPASATPTLTAATLTAAAKAATAARAQAAARTEATAALSAASSPNVTIARIPGLEVPDDVRREMLSSFEHAELPLINEPKRRLPFGVWVAAALVLAALLVFQIVRDNGDWLAVHARAMGGGISPATRLAAYQLRQWGVTGDPGAKGTLRVRASIMNASAQLQPYPLLRVTLANRFGTRIGSREFEPAEYLGKPQSRMLAPGERVDATLDIQDPGRDAEGFEIDVCLRGADHKPACAADAAAVPK